MSRRITNRYDAQAARPRLQVETAVVYAPKRESDWTYAHHPHMAYFQGKLYVIWSSGRVNEDDLGQRVMMAASDDFRHWSEPQALVDSRRGKHSEVVLTAGGLHRFDGGLTAYFGQYEYRSEQIAGGTRKMEDKGHCDTGLYAVTTTDGERWSEPRDMGVPLVPNHGPMRTSTGRLILSGNIMFPYSDDPSGLSGWQRTGIYAAELADGIRDDSESIWSVRERMGWPTVLCEGSCYETDDGMLRMLLRSNTQFLWVTESGDNGETWSAPKETDFTDNAAKFHFGRLPDGRYYYVGCPDPEPRWARTPLVLSLSDDGIRFDRHFILGSERETPLFPGAYKGGVYGYPHTLVHDGYLYVAYSVCKERIAVMRVEIGTF